MVKLVYGLHACEIIERKRDVTKGRLKKPLVMDKEKWVAMCILMQLAVRRGEQKVRKLNVAT